MEGSIDPKRRSVFGVFLQHLFNVGAGLACLTCFDVDLRQRRHNGRVCGIALCQTLKQFNEGLLEQSTALANQLATVSNTWRDQENKKFCEQFEQHMRLLARFVESNNDHIPYLLRKAERIEEYLQQR